MDCLVLSRRKHSLSNSVEPVNINQARLIGPVEKEAEVKKILLRTIHAINMPVINIIQEFLQAMPIVYASC